MRDRIKGRELRLLFAFFVLLTSAGFFYSTASAQERIVVAAASDVSVPLGEIAGDFERKTGCHVAVISGASGNLSAQIMNGAPFDAFMSADMEYPRMLIAHGKADGDTLFRYATGRLVLLMGRQAAHRTSDLSKLLIDSDVAKIAIANPKHAPYGKAAVEALKHLGVYEQVARKLVVAENVSQAAQFVESGNVQVGLVALSRALVPEVRNRTTYIEMPSEAYSPIQQGAVVLSRGKASNDVQKFMAYIKGADAAAILKRYGLEPNGDIAPTLRHTKNPR